jgi:hypothetical protein
MNLPAQIVTELITAKKTQLFYMMAGEVKNFINLVAWSKKVNKD